MKTKGNLSVNTKFRTPHLNHKARLGPIIAMPVPKATFNANH